MSGNSSVGQAQVYEAGDQRNVSEADKREAERLKSWGQENAHSITDNKDSRSVAQRAADEKAAEDTTSSGKKLDMDAKLAQKDPRLPALMKGNEPSKGAKIDAQIEAEEQEELRRKGKA